MNICLVSPLGFPITPESRYTGIERLVYEYACELVKSHNVTVMGHAESIFPEGVNHLKTNPLSDFILSELLQFQRYQSNFYEFDVIHDFSHQHFASRTMPNLPSLNIFWHAPALAKYPKAPYNIIALSQWAAREFKRVYQQEARYQQSILIDTERYKPLNEPRNDRFLTIGRMSPEKGNLNAIMLCNKLGVPLDIVGGRGAERSKHDPLTEYEQAIMDLCDGQRVRFLGEVDDNEKIRLMQTNRALLYCTNHPEVTSHKLQEAMLCGMGVIVPAIGATSEIVTQGVDGFICSQEYEFVEAMRHVDTLRPQETYEALKAKYSRANVCNDYVKLYEEVSKGKRW